MSEPVTSAIVAKKTTPITCARTIGASGQIAATSTAHVTTPSASCA